MIKKINTIVDGYDVKKVNLWPSPTDRTRIITSCTLGETVIVVDRTGDFSRIRNASGKMGWCNTSFLADIDAPPAKEYPMDSDMAIDKAYFDKEKEYTSDLRSLISRLWISRLFRKLRSL